MRSHVKAALTDARLLAALCLAVGVLAWWSASALAAAPPVVEESSVVDVAATSVTLKATINPEENETTYRFEYGTSEAYGSSVPVPDGLVGSGTTPLTVSAHPQDLLPQTEYHYRVVALVAAGGETVPGADGTFITQPAGGEFVLADGRQWELVSPPNLHGAQILPTWKNGVITQASEDGGKLTYEVDTPTEAAPQGYVVSTQLLSKRDGVWWSTRDIAPPHNSRTGIGSLNHPEYQFFSPDLSSQLTFPEGEDETLLSSKASEPTPYVRQEVMCESPASASECFLPLLTSKEGLADVPPSTIFGKQHGDFISGATPDLRHVLLTWPAALTTPAPPEGSLYEWSAGAPPTERLQLVSVLPASEGGGPSPTPVEAGVTGQSYATWSGGRHAISNDGSRIFWSVEPGFETRLYMRDTIKRETVRIDAPQPGAPPSGGERFARFQIASSDGSRVFFTDADASQRLTAQSGTQGYDLYECRIVEEAGKLKCDLTDLTPERSGESAEVIGKVVGASEDGSYLYFVANGVLAEGATQGSCTTGNLAPGEVCNLYEDHDGVIKFIALLSREDGSTWDEDTIGLARLTARVSPDGRYVAFTSRRSLTEYDNLDAVTGQPDFEVYLYDAMTEHLACVSCDPTGSRPVGIEGKEVGAAIEAGVNDDVMSYDPDLNIASPEAGIAANLPVADELGGGGSQLYQSRLLSDSGRLFFNSDDALVPQDVNGTEDVYEFEPVGVGGCLASNTTFEVKSGGCVSLISSGQSPEESGFVDASADGGDVFFLTTSKLVAQDPESSYKIYDAHECSMAVPCVSSPVSPPPCDSGDSCKASPTAQPSIFGASASATFTGAGNVVGATPVSTVTPKSLTRTRKLARALKACRGRHGKRRAVCERQARKRYGARAARRAATSEKGQG